MYLIKKYLHNIETKINISFEKVADELLMVSITNHTSTSGILSYWRLTKVTDMPPLEIGIDCENGILANITFFLDDSCIKELKVFDIPSKKGSIRVNMDIFNGVNDYIDVDQTYQIDMRGNKLTCAFENAATFKQSYRNGRLELYVNSEKNVVGFSVNNLSDEEVSLKQKSEAPP